MAGSAFKNGFTLSLKLSSVSFDLAYPNILVDGGRNLSHNFRQSPPSSIFQSSNSIFQALGVMTFLVKLTGRVALKVLHQGTVRRQCGKNVECIC